MFTNYWRPVLAGLLAGIVGVLLVLGIRAAWTDHETIQQLVNWVNSQPQNRPPK